MSNLAIVPARSGSKGLPNKNIKLFNGKPLIAYTIEAAKKSKLFDEIIVSTDSQVYGKIAMKYGASVPFYRSEQGCTDFASSWDVVKEVIARYKEVGKEFDTITLLQPTSPLRTENDIIKGYKLFKDYDANAVIAVCEADHSPLWMNTLKLGEDMSNFIGEKALNLPRQNLPTYYRINGALYIVKTDYIMKTTNIYEKKCFPTVMDKKASIDIDDWMDFKIAELFLTEKK